MVITPERFFDLFMLGLFWQSKGIGNWVQSFTTVDKVSRILEGLGVVTAKQRKSLFKDRHIQHLFLRNLERVHPLGADYRQRQGRLVRVDEDTSQQVLANSQMLLVYRADMQRDINRERLLRDYHLHLTAMGMAFAQSKEAEYASVVTRDKYLEEEERQRLMYETLRNEAARRAAVMIRYKEKVTRETGESDDDA